MMSKAQHLKSLLGIRVPIISAPMGNVAGGRLAYAVSKAGGYGFFGFGSAKPQVLTAQLDLVKQQTELEQKQHQSNNIPKIGVGFLGWSLEQYEEKEALNMINTAMRHNNVTSVWFAFGNDLLKWIKYAKAFNEKKIIVFVMVGTEEEAQKILEYGDVVDILVVQGTESGGHGWTKGAPLKPLFRRVVEMQKEKPGPLLVAGGGVGTARDVQNLLNDKDCSGVLVGTRFQCANESLLTDSQKQRLIKTKSKDTARSVYFDHMRGTLDWPENVDGRGVQTPLLHDLENKVVAEPDAMKEYEKVPESQGILWAGTGVDDIERVQDAKEILDELSSLIQ